MRGLLFSCLLLTGTVCASAQSDEQSTAPLEPIPKQLESAYFSKRPEHFLVDPQRLLRGRDERDRREFLEYSSGDSAIDLYVYLFKGDQSVPEDVNAGEVVDRMFAEGKPTVVVYYFMGQPERTAMYLSPELDGIVTGVEQERALETAVEQASQDMTPAKQFEKFTVQMAIRIYWMEQELQRLEDMSQAEEPSLDPDPGSADSREQMHPLIEQLLGLWRAYRFPLLLLVVVWGIRARCRRRARYRFPKIEVEARLGGPHAAGVGAVMSFASAAQSPAAQREQLFDS